MTLLKNEQKKKCCGCGGCVAICPRRAIHMVEDENGFVYPVIEQEKCSHCGLCDYICAYRKEDEQKWTPRKTYVAVSQNTDLKKSASGGVFASIATNVLQEGGIVYGCAMERRDGRMMPVHKGVERIEDLEQLMGSKYAQSSVTEICNDLKKQVLAGRKVLFSGTPCQVGMVRSLLHGRATENLLLVDIICHGAPSARLFGDYIDELEKRKKGEIQQFLFRDKAYGWSKVGSYTITKNGRTKKYPLPFRQSSYYADFMDAETYREECYQCKYAGQERVGDITIGDYWGVQVEHPELLSENGGTIARRSGVSCLMVNTDIGEKWIDTYQDSMLLFSSAFEKAAKVNTQLRVPSSKGKNREEVLALYRNGGYAAVERFYRKKLGMKWHLMMVKRLIPSSVKQKIKKIIKKS